MIMADSAQRLREGEMLRDEPHKEAELERKRVGVRSDRGVTMSDCLRRIEA